MILKHIALVCSSEANANRFYQDLLGLKKINSRILSSSLSRQIFNLDSEYKMVNYANDEIHFEIFLDPEKNFPDKDKSMEHVCLQVDNIKMFLEKCRSLDVKIKQIPKENNGFIIFINDYDGNLFEIK